MEYVAIYRTEVLTAEPTLAAALAFLADVQSPDVPEDAVVWHRGRVVAVRTCEGVVVRLDRPEPAPALRLVAPDVVAY